MPGCRVTLVLLIWLLLTITGCGGGATSTRQQESPADWVKSQAKSIQSIDPNNINFSDLAFFGTVLQGHNIVELGESGHGVAEFSQAKIRLIKYLHEQLGYDVIAFESSILSTYLASTQANQLTPTAFMQDSIFGVWSTTDVVKLFSYLQSTQNTAHPLILAGFDVQLTTPYEMRVRPGIFQQVVAVVDPVYAQQVYDLDQALAQNWYHSSYVLANYSDLRAKYEALTAFLDANMAQIKQAYPSAQMFPLIVRQAAWGMSAFLEELYDQDSNDGLGAANVRDWGMATNLELLIDSLYTGKKIIVWAHNAHLVHDGLKYEGFQNMGSYIFRKYGSNVYTLGLYMYQGAACWNGGGVCGGLYTIPPASDSSVEGLLHAAAGQYIFLDISQVHAPNNDTGWMYRNLDIREWGAYSSPITLKDQYDGLLQIDTVNPPTYVN